LGYLAAAKNDKPFCHGDDGQEYSGPAKTGQEVSGPAKTGQKNVSHEIAAQGKGSEIGLSEKGPLESASGASQPEAVSSSENCFYRLPNLEARKSFTPFFGGLLFSEADLEFLRSKSASFRLAFEARNQQNIEDLCREALARASESIRVSSALDCLAVFENVFIQNTMVSTEGPEEALEEALDEVQNKAQDALLAALSGKSLGHNLQVEFPDGFKARMLFKFVPMEVGEKLEGGERDKAISQALDEALDEALEDVYQDAVSAALERIKAPGYRRSAQQFLPGENAGGNKSADRSLNQSQGKAAIAVAVHSSGALKAVCV
jgi:hypothetical protein